MIEGNYMFLIGLAVGLIIGLIFLFWSTKNHESILISKADNINTLTLKNKKYYIIPVDKYLKMEAIYLIHNVKGKL